MAKLSPRQKSILQFIVSFYNENKFPPTIREIGEKVGITSTSVVNYNLAKLEEEKLLTRRREVSRGLSLNWPQLAELGLIEPAPNHTVADSNGASFVSNGASFVRGLIQVPVLGHIAAGEPIRVEPSDVTNPDEVIEMASALVGGGEKLFALRVKGDSMIDASVLDGDIVVLRHQETADDGDMVAAWIEGDEETTLKYLYREGRNVRLQPANPNPEYQPIVRPAEKVRVNGKVVSVIRVLKH